jgi:hypothetical protein
MDRRLLCVGAEIVGRCLRRGHGALDGGRAYRVCAVGRLIGSPTYDVTATLMLTGVAARTRIGRATESR